MSRFLMGVFLAAMLAGCEKHDYPLQGSDLYDEDRATLAGQSGQGAPSRLDDAEIAAIASTSNQIDIAAAQLARRKTQNPEVASFADMMITDHSSADDQAKALLRELDIAPRPNDLTSTMRAEAAATTLRLEALSGAEFDRAYVSAEVKFHEDLLDTLDRKLIPGADNAELAMLLGKVRPVVAMHLDHARMLEAKLR